MPDQKRFVKLFMLLLMCLKYRLRCIINIQEKTEAMSKREWKTVRLFLGDLNLDRKKCEIPISRFQTTL